MDGRIVCKRHGAEPHDKETQRLMDALRDPNYDLGGRLDTLDMLKGRKGLTGQQFESIEVYEAQLQRLLAERPGREIRTRAQRYYLDEAGELRRSL